MLREARKPGYPDADPDQWDKQRLVSERRTTYDEPVQYATVRQPAWTTLLVSGSELGKLDPYPSIGWNWMTGGEPLSGAIDRLQAGDLVEECPGSIETVASFRRQYPDHTVGAIVVRHYEECWPPVTLDGNHRALAALVAAREHVDVELTAHIGHEQSIDELPLQKATENGGRS